MKKILYILSFVAICLLSSCINRVDYTYEDVVVTRYDRWGPEIGKFGIWAWSHSDYYCNKSHKKNAIKVAGSQNYYSAYLLIDKQTKKVWIANDDCYIEQKNVDYAHFEGDGYNPSTHSYSSFYCDPDSLTQKYECYALCGTDAYWETEKKWTKKEFPDTKIKATYKMSLSRWLDEQIGRIFDHFFGKDSYDRQDLKADLAQYIEENEEKVDALKGWTFTHLEDRGYWWCYNRQDSFCACIYDLNPKDLKLDICPRNGYDSLAILDSISRNATTLYELKQLARIESISTRDISKSRTYPVAYVIFFYFGKEGRSKYKGEKYQVISVRPNYEISSHDTIDDQSCYIDCGSLYKNWRLRKIVWIK